jgi:hypothetical protein
MLVFGILLASGSRWAWIGVAPSLWFIGMVLSHIVFKRCVLNEIVIRMGKFKREAVRKVSDYQPKRPPMAKYREVRQARPTRIVLEGPGAGVLVARIYDEEI